jgi:hypothetical protein
VKNRRWFKENWKWFLPTVGTSIVVVLVASVVIAFIYVAGVVKTSTIYKQTLQKARENPAVRQRIGRPVKGGWFVDGTISVSHLSGQADFLIPLSGPKGKAHLRVVAQKVEGQWIYSALDVSFQDSMDVISLLPPENSLSESDRMNNGG